MRFGLGSREGLVWFFSHLLLCREDERAERSGHGALVLVLLDMDWIWKKSRRSHDSHD